MKRDDATAKNPASDKLPISRVLQVIFLAVQDVPCEDVVAALGNRAGEASGPRKDFEEHAYLKQRGDGRGGRRPESTSGIWTRHAIAWRCTPGRSASSCSVTRPPFSYLLTEASVFQRPRRLISLRLRRPPLKSLLAPAWLIWYSTGSGLSFRNDAALRNSTESSRWVNSKSGA